MFKFREAIFYMCSYKTYLAPLLNGAQFLRLVFDSKSRGKAQLPYEMSAHTTFKAQHYFYVLFLLCRQAGVKDVSVIQNAVNLGLLEWAFSCEEDWSSV